MPIVKGIIIGLLLGTAICCLYFVQGCASVRGLDNEGNAVRHGVVTQSRSTLPQNLPVKSP